MEWLLDFEKMLVNRFQRDQGNVYARIGTRGFKNIYLKIRSNYNSVQFQNPEGLWEKEWITIRQLKGWRKEFLYDNMDKIIKAFLQEEKKYQEKEMDKRARRNMEESRAREKMKRLNLGKRPDDW